MMQANERGFLTGVSLAAVVSLAALWTASAVEWEDPAVNSRNRLPARTYSMPLADEKAAFTEDLEPETPYKMSLNGFWKYSWAGNPDLRVADFWRIDFDDRAWFDMEVPSCVEMKGFGSPGYTNMNYPHVDASHPTNAHFATILDRQSKKHDYNPVSSYRRTFTIPETWKGRRVILRFDGVYSAYYVWVNGKKVGYAEDSKLPSEFDVTPYLNPFENSNTQTPKNSNNYLAVQAFRWCDGSYLEDQDMTRFSGIFRDVTLWSMPKDGVWDFSVRTIPAGGYANWTIEAKVEGEGEQRTDVSLYDAEHKKVGNLTPLSTSTSTYFLHLAAPRLWSAEDPYLYTLVIKRGADIRMKRIGFKEQKIVGATFLVNGQKIKFKGVNRHETSPERGRAITLADMVRDITLMKQYNINAVRTSHYPNHHLWYDLCDRYGIYVIAEANVEGHEPGYAENGLGRFPEWEHTILERNLRHVTFYRNHPSVTMWSAGNETGHGDGFRHTIAAVKSLDPSRPVHWERGNYDSDVDSRMYRSVEWCEARGKFGDAPVGTKPNANDKYESKFERETQSAGKCYFMCEYAHAMGNAIGNFAEYWDVFYRHDSLCGGCIWDWIDQAVWKETGRFDRRTGKPERFLSYGGDFDEEPNDGPFNCNGVIDPERHVTAKLVEVGHVHRNLVVEKAKDEGEGERRKGLTFELWNRFSFTKADAFQGTWKLLEDGLVVKSGSFQTPAVAPLTRGKFTVPGLAEALAAAKKGTEVVVDFAFLTKTDAPWAKRGWTVARDQIVLVERAKVEGERRTFRPEIVDNGESMTVTAGATTAVFSRVTGTLSALTMSGRTVLKDAAETLAAGPRLTCARAFVDNDVWCRQSFYDSGLTQLRYHARPIEVGDGVVKTTVEVTGSKSAGFTHVAAWRFAADGSLAVSNSVTPHGTMPCVLPRLGLTLRLDPALGRVEYYGRGPRENYVDRCTGSFLGRYVSSVDGLSEPYVRPQDNGYRSDVRWVDFTDGKGCGVRFSASEPLFVQAQHCTWEDLEFARHRNRQQRFRTPVERSRETFLNLDVRQLGLGGSSCGPEPMDKYVFPIVRTDWTLRLTPLH